MYSVYIFAFGLFVPLATIFVSYVSILRVVKKVWSFLLPIGCNTEYVNVYMDSKITYTLSYKI